MPPSGPRRRGRGRGLWRRDQGRAAATPDAEQESQQQQSSNRGMSGRDGDAKPDEKPSSLVHGRRGSGRKGRPRSTGGRGRGRLSREGPSPSDGARSAPRHGVHALDATKDACPEVEAIPTGRGRRRKNSKLHDESVGENDVSDVDASHARTDPAAVKPPIAEDPIPEPQTKNAKPIDVGPTDFPFPVFVDAGGVVRARHATYVLPFCVGSIAFWQGKKAPEDKCYRWVVYVRSPGGVDLSYVIKLVRFRLHPSFPQPERVVERPPYELEEFGWGEFEIGVTIEFVESVAGPSIAMMHSLKLYTSSEPSTKRPVVDEQYDELVFSEPPAAFFQEIRLHEDRRAPLSRNESFFPRYTSHLVDDCMHRINLVKSRIRNEVRELLAKAEASGIEIDLPSAKKLIEQVQNREAVVVKPASTEAAQEGRKGPEVLRRTRIVIDGDRPETPLIIEHEPLRKRLHLSRNDDLQPFELTGEDDMGKSTNRSRASLPQLLQVGENDGGSEIDPDDMEIDRTVVNRTHWEAVPSERALQPGHDFRLGPGAGAEREAISLEGGGSNGDNLGHPEEVSLPGELPPNLENSSDSEDSPRQSGSSSEAASGNQDAVFDDVADADHEP